jgi:hypothetical protein
MLQSRHNSRLQHSVSVEFGGSYTGLRHSQWQRSHKHQHDNKQCFKVYLHKSDLEETANSTLNQA